MLDYVPNDKDDKYHTFPRVVSVTDRDNEEFVPNELWNIRCNQWYYVESTRETEFGMQCHMNGVWANHSIPYSKCVMWIECTPPDTGEERLLTDPPGNIKNDTERR